jgi:hypothetical protein
VKLTVSVICRVVRTFRPWSHDSNIIRRVFANYEAPRFVIFSIALSFLSQGTKYYPQLLFFAYASHTYKAKGTFNLPRE